jgi:Concanavalin A-like lectin/glucanases superfamily/Collagen triple helix repeat (20 copies)
MSITLKGSLTGLINVKGDYVSGSGGAGTGAQGTQGDPGVDAANSSCWDLSIASGPTDIYPAAGEMKLYDAVSFQIAINTVSSDGIDVSQWVTSLFSIDGSGVSSAIVLMQEGDPGVYRVCSVTSVSGLYLSSGSYASIVSTSVLEQGGSLTPGARYRIMRTFGDEGYRGVQGSQGPQGLQGVPSLIPGNQGVVGGRGLDGHPADTGNPGDQGPQGLSIQGPQGYNGFPSEPTAVQGAQGPQGFQGLSGDEGADSLGTTGDQGHPGATGAQGDRGFQGSPGGVQGHPGPPGVQGPKGGIGSIGETGQTAYGPPGVQGPQGGVQGAQGVPGFQGPQGIQGPQGVQGEIGTTGIPGNQGLQGPQGNKGLGFIISKIYNSDADRASASGGSLPADGEFGLVAGTLSELDPDYGKLYLYTTAGGWSLKTDMSISGYQGSVGPQGLQGPSGTQGNQGSSTVGIVGFQGHNGIKGLLGIQGHPGFEGGYQGNQGNQGTQGIQGSTLQSLSGTGLVYTSGGLGDVASIGVGFSTVGSSGSRTLIVPGAQSRPSIDANHIHVYNCSESSGTSLVDSGSGARNMSISGSAGTDYYLGSYTAGRTVPGIMFLKNGSSVPTGGAFASNCSITGPDFSMEAVINVPNSTSAGHVVMRLKNTANNNYVHLTINGSGGLYAGVYIGAGGSSAADTGAISVVYGTPQHVLVTTSKNFSTGATTVRLYIDGILRASNATSSTATLPTMTQVMIGQDNVTSGYSLRACFRDVRVSNTTRSAAYALSSANALLAL